MRRIYTVKGKVLVRTPGNKLRIHDHKKRVKPKVCAICKTRLNGVASKPKSELSKLSKSDKTVSRIYGGYLCHNCLSRMIKDSVRVGVKQ